MLEGRNKLIYLIYIYLISLISHLGYSQTKIKGFVNDSLLTPLKANIILKDSLNHIINYAYSLENGSYIIETKKKGKINITFSSLSYKSKTISYEIINQKEITIDAILEEQPFELNEIIIQSEKDIKIKKDTITFKTNFFTNGTEQTVEDLLKKIPGLKVDNEGTIKVGNQEIEKLMIDGDDLFERGYKILSKNMPAYPIEEVEVIEEQTSEQKG